MSASFGRVTFIMLGVKDLDRSVEFYRDYLGLSIKSRDQGLATVDAGSITIALSTALGGTRPGRLAGATEIVFGVSGVRDAFNELSARGVKFLTQPHQVSGTDWAAAFTDPDGHAISIFGPKT
jgi:predicted enzyme related to lactoylglutathione lyase